ncbi:MAG: hypothetical protein AAF805_04800 [Planctomycetota bacterium]
MLAPVSRRYRTHTAACLLLGLTASVGCGDPSEEALAPPPPPPTPAERFESLVAALKDYVGDQSSQARVAQQYAADPSGPVASGEFLVEESYQPPEGKGPHIATLCFTTKSSVTVTLPPPSGAGREDANDQRSEQLKELGEGLEGVADLDSLIVPSPETLGARLGASPTVAIENDETRTCYELEYRDGKWEAVTELDRIEQPFYTLAVEYALLRQ